MSFLHLVSKLFAGSNHIFPNPGPIAITLCWGHVSLLGQANTKWLPHRARSPPLSLISGGFIRTLPDETSFQHFVPFDDTSSFFQSITPACPASAGSCLACRVQSVWWHVTKRRACGPSAHQQGGRQGGKCLNLKFTTQVTGSLQLSSSSDDAESNSDSQDKWHYQLVHLLLLSIFTFDFSLVITRLYSAQIPWDRLWEMAPK